MNKESLPFPKPDITYEYDEQGRISSKTYHNSDQHLITYYTYIPGWTIESEECWAFDGKVHYRHIRRYNDDSSIESSLYVDYIHNTISQQHQTESANGCIWREIEIGADGRVTHTVTTNRPVEGGLLEQVTTDGHITEYTFYPQETFSPEITNETPHG